MGDRRARLELQDMGGSGTPSLANHLDVACERALN